MIPVRRLLFAATLAAAAAGPVLAQGPQAAPAVGATVREASGQVLGRVEAVTLDNEGRPVQVVVRSRRLAGVGATSRSLPIAGLRRQGDGWATPLRRAEFDLLPKLAK